jgi:hypothetical protein
MVKMKGQLNLPPGPNYEVTELAERLIHQLLNMPTNLAVNTPDLEPGRGVVREYRVERFRPIPRPLPMAAIDSSVIPLGIDDAGSVFLGRVAVALSQPNSRRFYLRAGPLLLRPPEGLMPSRWLALMTEEELAARVLRNYLEQVAQHLVAEWLEGGIILVDGALAHPPQLGSPSPLRAAQARENIMVGISKNSRISSVQRVIRFLSAASPPCYIELGEGPQPGVVTAVARFTLDGLPVRVDLADPLDRPVAEALSAMLGSDSYTSGYPELLRLAHHLAVFTRSEELLAAGLLPSLLESGHETRVRHHFLGRVKVSPQGG